MSWHISGWQSSFSQRNVMLYQMQGEISSNSDSLWCYKRNIFIISTFCYKFKREGNLELHYVKRVKVMCNSLMIFCVVNFSILYSCKLLLFYTTVLIIQYELSVFLDYNHVFGNNSDYCLLYHFSSQKTHEGLTRSRKTSKVTSRS